MTAAASEVEAFSPWVPSSVSSVGFCGSVTVTDANGLPVNLTPLTERLLVALCLLPEGQWWDLDELATVTGAGALRPALSRLGHEIGHQAHLSRPGRVKRVALDRSSIHSAVDQYRHAVNHAAELGRDLPHWLTADAAWPATDFRTFLPSPNVRLGGLIRSLETLRERQCARTAAMVRQFGSVDIERIQRWVDEQPKLEECRLTLLWATRFALGPDAANEILQDWQLAGLSKQSTLEWAARNIDYPVEERVETYPAPTIQGVELHRRQNEQVRKWLDRLQTERVGPLVISAELGPVRIDFTRWLETAVHESGHQFQRVEASSEWTPVDCLIALVKPWWVKRRLSLEPPGKDLEILAGFLDRACGFTEDLNRLESETGGAGSPLDRLILALTRLIAFQTSRERSSIPVVVISHADAIAGLDPVVDLLRLALSPRGIGLVLVTRSNLHRYDSEWVVEVDEHGPHHTANEAPTVSAQPIALDPALRRVLSIAAVTSQGIDIDSDLAAELLRPPQRPLLATLSRCTGGLVRVVGNGTQFSSHDARDAMYFGLDPELRRILHSEAFDRLRNRHAIPSASTARALLFHAEGSSVQSNLAEAVTFAYAAAQNEIDRYHDEEAESLISVALGRAEYRLRYPLFMLRGDLLRAAGRWEEARSSYVAAADVARLNGESHSEVTATIRLAHITRDPDDSLGLEHRLKDLYDRLHSNDTLLRIKVAACLAGGLYQDGVSGNTPNSAADATRTIAASAELPDGPDAADLLMWARKARLDIDHPRRSLATARLMKYRSGSSSYHHYNTLLAMIVDEIRLGRLKQARGHSVEYLALADAVQAPLFGQIADTIETMWQLRAGEYPQPSKQLSEPRRRSTSFGGATNHQIDQGQQIWIAHDRGLLNSVLLKQLAPAFPKDQRIPLWTIAQAWLHAEHGDARLAWATIHSVVPNGHYVRGLPRGPHRLPLLALLAEALSWLTVRRSRTRESIVLANAISEQLDAHPDRYVLIGWPIIITGSINRYRGLAAFAAGQLAEALPPLHAALDHDQDSPPSQARIWLDLAQTSSQLCDTPSSIEAATNAHDLAQQFGMTSITKAAQKLIADK